LTWYNNRLKAKPISTSAVSAAFIFGFGDFFTQKYLSKEEMDLERLRSAVVSGVLLRCPLAYIVYRII